MLRHLRACSNLIQRSGQRQFYTSNASVTEEMLKYVQSPETKRTTSSEQIRDILRGGISQQTGTDAARLNLALSELEFEENRWDEAAHTSELASRLCQDELLNSPRSPWPMSDAEYITAVKVLDASDELKMRSLMSGGQDEQVEQAAQQTAYRLRDLLGMQVDGKEYVSLYSWDGHGDIGSSYAASTKGRIMYSMQVMKESMRDSLGSIVQMLTESTRHFEVSEMDSYNDITQQSTGVLAFLEGDGLSALTRFEAVADLADGDREIYPEYSPISQYLLQESELAASLGRVQVDLAVADTQDSWKECEAPLEEVLNLAEGMGKKLGRKRSIGGPATHSRVIPVLMCLADVYSHTGRVTLAEGLYRTAGKAIYRSQDPASGFAMRDPCPVHPTLAALLAWRYAQLLSALPKRDAEAELWGSHARELFKAAFPGKAIEEYFGDEERLKGKGARPKGVFIDSTVRRVLLCTRSVTVNG